MIRFENFPITYDANLLDADFSIVLLESDMGADSTI